MPSLDDRQRLVPGASEVPSSFAFAARAGKGAVSRKTFVAAANRRSAERPCQKVRTVEFLPGVEEDPSGEAQGPVPVITTNGAFCLLHNPLGYMVSDALGTATSGRFVHIQVPVDRSDVVEVLFVAPATFGGEPVVVVGERDP